MLYMEQKKTNFKIKGKIICELKDFLFFFIWIFFPPFEWFKCDTCVFQDWYFKRQICFLWIVTYSDDCIYIMKHKMFTRIILLVNSFLCYIKKNPHLFVFSCLFLSGVVVLRCFGHVYKLDCAQLKLVCLSMETWLRITWLFSHSEWGWKHSAGSTANLAES